jgi:hypothetical protein
MFADSSGLPTTSLRTPQTKTWVRVILPLGVLFSFSLVLNNVAYVHLSVSFVQMLKVSPTKCSKLERACFAEEDNSTNGALIIGVHTGAGVPHVYGNLSWATTQLQPDA